ncbi:MAG: hypothetical protein IID33_07200, partial [Planctomycetes bacterium]|nr:hypothetical protein [Planctomycetota bacterium]
MKLNYRRLSAEDVLAVLTEDYRQQCANGDAASGSTLTLDSTISYWHGALIADDWRYDQVGVYLNGLFDTHFSKATWHATLRPYRRTRLRSVCELIASQAVVADIRPIRILGRECLAAGAFKAIRERLSAAGADVSDLRPSTSLSDFACRNFQEVYREFVRLAPRKIPEMRCVMPPNLAARHALRLVGSVVLAVWAL